MSQILTSGGFWGSVIYCRPDISFLQISIRIGVGGVGVGVFPPVALASGKKNPPAMQETQETQV